MHNTRAGKGRAILKFIIGLLIVFIIVAGLYLFVQEYDRTPSEGIVPVATPIGEPTLDPALVVSTPEPQSEATPEPTAEPVDETTQPPVEIEATDAPEEPRDEPTPEPENTGDEPVAEDTAEPQPEPTDEPQAQPDGSAEPEITPTQEPEPEPTEEPAQEPQRTLSSRMEGMSVPAQTEGATYGMLEFKPGEGVLSLSAYLSASDISSQTAQYYLVAALANGRAAYVYDTWPVENNTGLESDLACFAGAIDAHDLPDGWYRLGLMAVDGDNSCCVSIDDDAYSFVVSAGRLIRYAE